MGGKRGACSFQWPAAILLIVSLLAATFPVAIKPVHAVETLTGLRDVLTDTSPGAKEVHHKIMFDLPVDSQPITPTDWIIIQLTNFTNLTDPQTVDGLYGTPNTLVSGNTIYLTNVATAPGSSVTITDFTATNPKVPFSFEIVVSISSGPDQAGIRNQARSLANQSGALVAVTATVDNPLSSLYISGYTGPGSFITLSTQSAVIATAGADELGAFAFSVTGLDDGNYTFSMSGTDTNGRSTATETIQLFLLKATLTTVTDIMLSPTIDVGKAIIQPGDTETIYGSARPGATINLFVESPLRSYSTTTDSTGAWSYTLDSSTTSQFAPGQYRAYANVQDENGNQSIVSNTVNFIVQEAGGGNNPPPACDISHGDLNCDGKTNLSDFSILLYHWRTNHKVADINGDGQVNLVDFSIMMFYFKR